MPGRSIVDSRLRSWSSLDRKTHPKSKNRSRALPQKTLDDDGSIKLSILVGEWMSWLSILHFCKPRPLLPIVRACIWNGTEWLAWTVWCRLDGAERNENVTIFLAATVHMYMQVPIVQYKSSNFYSLSLYFSFNSCHFILVSKLSFILNSGCSW